MVESTLDYILKKYGVEEQVKKRPVILNISRWNDLPALFNELGFEIGAEIGVATGLYSEHLRQQMPGLRLYCIDAWIRYPGYRWASRARFKQVYDEATERLTAYGCEIVLAFSTQAASQFKDNSLDFVFIDGNHDFLNVTLDIAFWERKVRPGGIVCGHDYHRKYGRDYVCHVKDVVLAWTYAHSVKPLFVLKGKGEPCWMWVKEAMKR